MHARRFSRLNIRIQNPRPSETPPVPRPSQKGKRSRPSGSGFMRKTDSGPITLVKYREIPRRFTIRFVIASGLFDTMLIETPFCESASASSENQDKGAFLHRDALHSIVYTSPARRHAETREAPAWSSPAGIWHRAPHKKESYHSQTGIRYSFCAACTEATMSRPVSAITPSKSKTIAFIIFKTSSFYIKSRRRFRRSAPYRRK